jgi:hypothetical protein
MLQIQTVDNRPAVVAYFNDDHKLVNEDEATLVKVVFTDELGGHMWLIPDRGIPEETVLTELNPYHEPEGASKGGERVGGRFAKKNLAYHPVDPANLLARAEPGWSYSDVRWQDVAEEARAQVLKENDRLKADSVRLSKELNRAMEMTQFHTYMIDWYREYHGLATELFGEYEPTFSKFVAAAAQGTAGQHNVKEAIRAMRHYLTGGRFDDGSYKPSGYTAPRILENYINIQKNRPLGGRKIWSFYQNLLGRLSVVTGDRHMIALIFGKKAPQKKSKSLDRSAAKLTVGQRAVMQAVVSSMAKKLGWAPAELQAVLWAVVKSNNHKGLPADIWDYKKFLIKYETEIRALMAIENKPAPLKEEEEALPTPSENEILVGCERARLLLTILQLMERNRRNKYNGKPLKDIIS